MELPPVAGMAGVRAAGQAPADLICTWYGPGRTPSGRVAPVKSPALPEHVDTSWPETALSHSGTRYDPHSTAPVPLACWHPSRTRARPRVPADSRDGNSYAIRVLRVPEGQRPTKSADCCAAGGDICFRNGDRKSRTAHNMPAKQRDPRAIRWI